MPAIRIGINPISWSNDDLPSLGGETPLSTALSEGKQIGYEGFELNGKFPKDAKGVGDVLRAPGRPFTAKNRSTFRWPVRARLSTGFCRSACR